MRAHMTQEFLKWKRGVRTRAPEKEAVVHEKEVRAPSQISDKTALVFT